MEGRKNEGACGSGCLEGAKTQKKKNGKGKIWEGFLSQSIWELGEEKWRKKRKIIEKKGPVIFYES